MNGADALIASLLANGVDTCFANPGTSEMHFVAALDRNRPMRAVLCLFEGVATGAADGFARIAGKPACTLLHLGPGLANGWSNLHNARRAGAPIVNIVGDHATYHRDLDAPLTSDIESLAATSGSWVRCARSADEVGTLAAQAVAASIASPSGPVCMVLPADCAWSPTDSRGDFKASARPAMPSQSAIESVASSIRAAKKPILLLGGLSCTAFGLTAAGRLAALGLSVMTDTFLSRQSRGVGRFAPRRMKYFAEMAAAELADADLVVLVETTPPVSFFAYPGKPSVLTAKHCAIAALADRGQNGSAALAALADALDAPTQGASTELAMPQSCDGPLTAESVGCSFARHMPTDAIVSEDASTSAQAVFAATRCARPHDWLMLTGGAIGQAIPAALGASIARPDRKVIALVGDGAAMYTAQALWSIARENADVTIVICANHAYRILDIEFERTGAGKPGTSARRLLDLSGPKIDWVALSTSLGVPAVRCRDAAAFDGAFADAMNQNRPRLIEAEFSTAAS